MRIIYYTQPFFSDCDFPLIRELQKRESRFRVYIPVQSFRIKSGLLNLKKLKKLPGLYRASKYPELKVYQKYLDLRKIYIINLPDSSRKTINRLVWALVFFHMLCFWPKIFHFNWQLEGRERWLYKLPVRKYMTVHDPLSHSSVKSEWEEQSRIIAFNNSDRFILLSDVLKKTFSNKYKIPESRIDIARMGEFSHLRYLKPIEGTISFPYILFFGQILSYKGIEYLCEAMTIVHKVCPELHLVIAGNGKIYFDYSPYEGLDYIHLKNEFIPIDELAGLLQDAMFTVCPYKDATQSGVVQTSFSCNTPIIVTNVGALPKVVKHNETGLVVPPQNTKSLADAIIRLTTAPDLLNTFKKNIEHKWRPSMSWGPIADIYLQSYQKIVNE